jgi:hypothetical protein
MAAVGSAPDDQKMFRGGILLKIGQKLLKEEQISHPTL